MADETQNEAQEFEAPDLVCKAVTVFADRAEVKREIKLTLNEGKNEVIVKKLPATVDQDSIRVEGTGKATICEVQFQTKHLSADQEEKKTRRNELQEQLQQLNQKMMKMTTELRRFNRKREVLDGLAQQIATGRTIGATLQNSQEQQKQVLSTVLDSLEGLDKYLVHYEDRVAKVDEEIFENMQKTKELQKEIDLVNKNLRELGGWSHSVVSREVSVILEGAKDGGEVTLLLSYVVAACGWTPSYDVRVFTEEKKMKIQYYGEVRQNSGEEWADASLFLSTATPSIAGQIPELNQLRVSFVPERPPASRRESHTRERNRMAKRAGGGLFGAVKADEMPMDMMMEESEEQAFGYAAMAAPMAAPMMVAETQAKQSVVSTCFEIARRTTVPSDGTGHKVNVAVLDLTPSFAYVSVPRKAAHAFLKATVVNSSSFPLLPGPVAVFLDNNFVAKAFQSSLKAVSPQEEFSVSLGVDPAVRVDYKPAQKFQEEAGMFTKASVVTHVQRVSVKNTRQDKLSVLIMENVPLSTDEKIKVTLLEPVVGKERSEKGATMNKDNNLEWTVEVGAGEEKNITIRYTIESPKGKELEFDEAAVSVGHSRSSSIFA